MNIDILTLFPGFFESPLNTSILKRSLEANIIKISLTDIRAFTTDKHHKADDSPFGGGCGMVMKPEPIFKAYESLNTSESTRTILLCPKGKPFNQKHAEELSKENHLVFLCGHYEGIDERVNSAIVTDEFSLGDFVLTGGEVAALMMIDAIARLIPGVLGNAESHENDSFSDGLLDYPHYTRPRNFRGLEVPDILLSGDHAKIAEWRLKEKLKATLLKRPDLLENYTFSKSDKKLLKQIKEELNLE